MSALFALGLVIAFALWREIDWRSGGVRALLMVMFGGIALVLMATPVEVLAWLLK